MTLLALACLLLVVPADGPEPLDLLPSGPIEQLEAHDTRVEWIKQEGRAVLQMTTGHSSDWPGVRLAPRDEAWDLSARATLLVEVRNVGEQSVQFYLRVDDDKGRWINASGEAVPGATIEIRLPLRALMPESASKKLFGMRGYPGGMVTRHGIDTRRVRRIGLSVRKPQCDNTLDVLRLQAEGTSTAGIWLADDIDHLMPLVDRHGQFRHADWPGKTRSDDDLLAARRAEAIALRANPGPKGWNTHGGHAEGPLLEATGFFRVEKVADKWWLVDPEGRLFWSHGIDCVRWTTGTTPITDREHYFAELPPRDGPLGRFFGTGSWAPHGYYHDRGPYETYNVGAVNLFRKHGPEWEATFSDLCHARLRSWGLNTIGNWSEPSIYLMGKTPYVATVSASAPKLAGSNGYWGKFPDVFDEAFVEALDRGMVAITGKTKGDSRCLGYFIGNELSWGDELSLATATLASPPDQPAKQAMVAWLRERHDTIETLNTTWGSDHASWEDLLAKATSADPKQAHDDLADFTTETARRYFRLCRDAVRRHAPGQLYLGCRFAWQNDRAVRAAAEYCDVVSFNLYRDSVADFALPEGVDKPVIIGEFHFGALDRGMLHTGLRPVADQEARARAYRAYVEGALRNPFLVGTHWFQYADQATTGRGDGENYQIGFLDICDTPYGETVEAARQVGEAMYSLRLESP